MICINALSLAPDVRDWLANSRHPRILHVFDYACNLINERREILSIVTRQLGDGPFNLVIDDDVLFSDHLNANSPISIRANQLCLGDLTINMIDPKLWSPRPDWEMLHAKRDDILCQIMSLRGQWSPARSNLLANLEIASSQRASTLLATTLSNLPITNSLISSLANADPASSLIAAQQLAGLGQGLTPAGDDFIIGAVLAAWIIHPPEVASILAEEITKTAAPLTTSLSAAWLRSAGKGEAGILWHNFFDALISAGPGQIRESINKILSVGETSGADALAGFMGMFISYEESEAKLCRS